MKGAARPDLDQKPSRTAAIVFISIIVGALIYMVFSLQQDLSPFASNQTTWLPYILLGVALLIALGFEFVNGFHDTANAVATVIYTKSMPAPTAVPFWRSLMFAQPPSSSAAATVATRAGEAGRRKVLFMRVLQARWAGALQMRRVQRQDAPVSL